MTEDEDSDEFTDRSLRARITQRAPPFSLTVVTGLIAAAMVFPLTWLVFEALTVDASRARTLLFRSETMDIVVNSLLLMGLVTVFSILLGVPLAYLTSRTNLPFRRFFTVAVALPLVVPSYVGAFAFVSAFGPFGEFQSLLGPLGVDRVPEIYGLWGSALVITLYTYPYVYLTTRAALLSFDESLVDAARTLNHGRLSAFRRITLPQVRPAIAAGALLAALYAISDFGTPAIMQYPVFTRQIYVENQLANVEFSALLSLQLISVVVVVLGLEWWIRSDSIGESEHSRQGISRIDLGVLRWPATLLPTAVLTFALVVPVWILVRWMQIGDHSFRTDLAFEWSYAYNSLTLAFAAAVVAVILALPVAYFDATHESRLALVFERATYVGFAVPGVVLAFALVHFATGYTPRLYQTVPLLVFAYVVRFLPQAVGSVRTTILQIDSHLAEAGRVLGESSLGVFRRITLPLTRSGIITGAALVFLTTMKELPATLILRPTGFETLSTQIWRVQDSALYQHAAVPALILLGISALSMLVLLAQDSAEERL